MPPLSDEDQLLRQRILHLIDTDPMVQRVIEPRSLPLRRRVRHAMITGVLFAAGSLGVGKNDYTLVYVLRVVVEAFIPKKPGRT